MSKVSEISHQYKTSLTASQQAYEDMYRRRAEATQEFYEEFFHQLICPMGDRFKNQRFRARLQELIERQVGTRTLNFIAIDGTCRRWTYSDFVTFFGGAYGARGSIDLDSGAHTIKYNRWSLDQDVSMVAWVPIPFARLEEVSRPNGEQFLVTEEERVNLSSIHVQVMQLAEIFLAYNTIIASRLESPNILLMDLSPSSVLASVAQSQTNIGLVGYPYDRRSLTSADITVAIAHPFSKDFQIPSPKKMDLYRLLISELKRDPQNSLMISEVAERLGIQISPNEINFSISSGVAIKLSNSLLETGIEDVPTKID